eukprot:7985768-Pyramimonas_sp.AAC.1
MFSQSTATQSVPISPHHPNEPPSSQSVPLTPINRISPHQSNPAHQSSQSLPARSARIRIPILFTVLGIGEVFFLVENNPAWATLRGGGFRSLFVQGT